MIDLRPRADGYDGNHYLSVVGTGPLGDGETLKLSLGESIVCGRSRHCQWSLKRTPRYLKSQGNERDTLRRSLAWRATSRRHCRITYLAPDQIDVEDLSRNGTFVDGHRVDRILLGDCRTKTHQVQLGPRGVVLEIRPGSLPLA